jgi:hypothetical protein
MLSKEEALAVEREQNERSQPSSTEPALPADVECVLRRWMGTGDIAKDMRRVAHLAMAGAYELAGMQHTKNGTLGRLADWQLSNCAIEHRLAASR